MTETQETTAPELCETERIRELEEQNAQLSSQLAQQAQEKGELAKFAKHFPSVCYDTIPTAVFEHATKESLPLYAAYAVYAWETEAKKSLAAAREEENRRKGTGGIAGTASERSFSREDLLAMTPDEVRRNFAEIIQSLAN